MKLQNFSRALLFGSINGNILAKGEASVARNFSGGTSIGNILAKGEASVARNLIGALLLSKGTIK